MRSLIHKSASVTGAGTRLSCLALLVAACGSNMSATMSPDGSTPPPDAAGDGSPPTQSVSSCPEEEPNENDPCSLTFDCSYGQSVRPDCRDRWTCRGGTWTRVGSCVDAAPGYCPAQQPMEASACTPIINPEQRAGCEYSGNTFCECPCPTSGPNIGCAPSEQWMCYGPSSAVDCPSLIPNLGTACTVQGTQCIYGDPCNFGGAVVICVQSVWRTGDASCPT
jgi:hypothetical protein